MPSPPTINVKELLVPIPGGSPSGRSLRFSAEIDELVRAAKEDDPAMSEYLLARGEKPKTADWKHVLKLGTMLLKEKSKDLEVAARVTEALGRLFGFAGLRDGLRLIRGVHVLFWETYFPEVKPPNLTARQRPFTLLDTLLPAVIRTIPLTDGLPSNRYSLARVQGAQGSGGGSGESAEAISGEQPVSFEEAIVRSSRAFYESLKQDVDACFIALGKLERTNVAIRPDRARRLSTAPPRLVNARKALEEFRLVVDQTVEEKRAADPTYLALQPPGPAPGEGGGSDEESQVDGELGVETESAQSPGGRRQEPVRHPAKSIGRAGPIATVDDAIARILESAAYLRQNVPASPVSFLTVRAVRMGMLSAEDGADRFGRLKPPTSTTRERLVQLQDEGNWGELLEEAEQVLGRDEGGGWLDADYFADLALRSGDADRSTVVAVTRSLLRAWLRDYPGWPDTTFQRDRTATAAAETRQWLRSEIVAETEGPAGAVPARREPVPEPAGEPGEAGPPRPSWERARELMEQGEVDPAIQLLRAALPRAMNGRERFLIKLHLAELFLARERCRLALVILEDLASQVDALRLEQWEDNGLLARVWAALYRCLVGVGAEDGAVPPERLKEVYARLLLLDINLALSLASDAV